jgi:hypothetical protein
MCASEQSWPAAAGPCGAGGGMPVGKVVDCRLPALRAASLLSASRKNAMLQRGAGQGHGQPRSANSVRHANGDPGGLTPSLRLRAARQRRLPTRPRSKPPALAMPLKPTGGTGAGRPLDALEPTRRPGGGFWIRNLNLNHTLAQVLASGWRARGYRSGQLRLRLLQPWSSIYQAPTWQQLSQLQGLAALAAPPGCGHRLCTQWYLCT